MPPKSKKKKSRGDDEQESRWERSPDPPESWDSDKDWEVGDIVDMHIDVMDPRKRSYKITWPGWRREDGTNTTWMPAEDCLEQFPKLVKAFEKKLQKGRAKLPAPPNSHSTSLLHIDEVALGMYNEAPRRRVPPGAAAARSTASRRQATTTNERASDRAQSNRTPAPASSAAPAKRKRSPLFGDTDESDEADELDIIPPPSKPSSSRNSASRQTASRQSSNGRHVNAQLPSRRFTSLTPSPPPQPVDPPSDGGVAGPSRRPQPESSRSLRSQTSRRNNTYARDTSSAGSSTLVPSTMPVDTSAAELEADWYERLPDDVAVITIESPNGDCPRLPRDFRYLESSYLGEEDKEYEDGFFLSCQCTDTNGSSESYCTTTGACSCLSENGVLAYDDNRRFTFNSFDLVVECNEYCACDAATCTNRVAQLPRDVPLQIFRTDECGWGVRPTVRLERGKVIGVCTGELIERGKAEQLQSPVKDYAWDLDFNERAEEEPENRGQSILSYSCGNWTRFLNHACEPNLRTYPVLYDHPQIPKLAFVACKPVEPFEELLLDYRDMSGTRYSANSPTLRQRRRKAPEGSKTCKCGAPSCRGWY